MELFAADGHDAGGCERVTGKSGMRPLTSARSRKAYPGTLRRVGYWDEETRRSYVFVTNNTTWVGKTIANLYKSRWQIELFLKWDSQCFTSLCA